MDEMSKQGLFFWLKSVVESGRCPGVTWCDQANGIFQIPWSNQKSRTWQKEDSSVFLEYAKHTSKYKPGDKMDFPKWKQNLKSAINKNRYIERLRVHDHLSGPKPYRVYRFMSEKTERKRSSDDVPDVNANVTVDYLSQTQLSLIESVGGLRYNEVLVAQRDTSASGAVVVYSDSGSRTSRSPDIPRSDACDRLQGDIPRSDACDRLQGDIPRSDACDRLQGNIPTFVTTYCETTNDLSSGDDSLFLESALPDASQYILSNTDISTWHEFSQNTDALEKNANNIQYRLVKTQENEKQKPNSLQVLVNETSQEQTQPEIISHFLAVTSHNVMPFTSFGQDSVYVKSGHDSNAAARVPNIQGLNYPVIVQQSVLSSSSDNFLNISQPVIPDAALSLPVIGVQDDVSLSYLNEPDVNKQPAGQENNYGIISGRDTAIAHEELTTSLPELEAFGECSSDQPTSMDTYDDNHPSVKQPFSGSQFTTYREGQMPENASKTVASSPSVKAVPDDSVMHVQVLYGTPHWTVKKIHVGSKTNSCRLFYGSVSCSFMQKAIKGQQDAEEVELPSVDNLDNAYHDENKKDAIRKVLKDMELGIVISYSNDDIFVERRCLPRVYLTDGVSKSESLPRSTKKRPDVKTLAFDYKQFTQSIEMNKTNNDAVPKDHFFLTIGYQIIPNDDSPTRLIPVYIVVRHVKAALERFKILGASTIAPNPMCSDPTSFDDNVKFFREIDLK